MTQNPSCSVPREEVSALLLGAGIGNRLGGNSKPFLIIEGETLLERAISLVAPYAQEILVGLEASMIDRGCTLIGPGNVQFLAGGKTRQETMEILLRASTGNLILEHDVARPFATANQVRQVLEAAEDHGAAVGICRNEVRDSTGLIEDDTLQSTLPRKRMVSIRGPHAYCADWIQDAFDRDRPYDSNAESTPTLLLAADYPCRTVESTLENIKITYPEDLALLSG